MYDSLYAQEVHEVCVCVITLAYDPHIRSIQYNLFTVDNLIPFNNLKVLLCNLQNEIWNILNI